MNERLKHRLEIQALDIEAIMAQEGVNAQIRGGYVGHDAVTFEANSHGQRLDARTRNALRRALEDTLGTPAVSIITNGSRLNIEVATSGALRLLELLDTSVSHSAGHATLGWATDDRPLRLALEDRILNHVIVLGESGAGKTALLRTYAVSLAISSRQAQAQMVFVDPQCARPEPAGGPGLGALHYLPHALSAVLTQLEDIANGLSFLVGEMRHRRSHRIRRPAIVIFIDNVDHLLEVGGSPVRDGLHHLLSDGKESGIQVAMAARPPAHNAGDEFNALLSLKPVLRIAGRVENAAEAESATQLADSGAEQLLGRGDFLVAREDGLVRFQSAFVDAYDLHWCLESLQRRRPPTLLARSTTARPVSGPLQGNEQDDFNFSFDGNRVSLSDPLHSVENTVD